MCGAASLPRSAYGAASLPRRLPACLPCQRNTNRVGNASSRGGGGMQALQAPAPRSPMRCLLPCHFKGLALGGEGCSWQLLSGVRVHVRHRSAGCSRLSAALAALSGRGTWRAVRGTGPRKGEMLLSTLGACLPAWDAELLTTRCPALHGRSPRPPPKPPCSASARVQTS